MFRSFGCDDDFRFGQHHDRDCKRDDFHRDDSRRRFPFCNVLANIAIGTEIELLQIKDSPTPFNNVVFEGFSKGVALFSGVNTGLLRVCPEDIVAIVI